MSELVERARFLASGQDDPHSATITELCDRIEQLERELGWQDIATAPKDGTPILLFGDIPGSELLGEQTGCVFSGYWDSLDGAWCATVSTWQGPFCTASHWRPLPEPPAIRSGDAG